MAFPLGHFPCVRKNRLHVLHGQVGVRLEQRVEIWFRRKLTENVFDSNSRSFHGRFADQDRGVLDDAVEQGRLLGDHGVLPRFDSSAGG